jgi:hypothetical protein
MDEQSMEPRLEPVGIAKPDQVPPSANESLLDRIPRELAVAEDQAGRGIQPSDRRADEQLEGVMIALLRPHDEFSFGHRRPAICLDATHPVALYSLWRQRNRIRFGRTAQGLDGTEKPSAAASQKTGVSCEHAK